MPSRLREALAGASITGLVVRALMAAALMPLFLFEFMVAAPARAFVLALLTAALAIAVVALIVTRRLIPPLAASVRGLQAIASGQLDHTLPTSTTLRELDAVAVSFNGMTSRFQDSTDRLVHQAFHDPLTGLPNRALFMTRVKQALTAANRKGAGLAVLFIDVDRFKVLNDSLGHTAGDKLLATISRRLLAAVGDRHTVARFGGDEFTILIESRGAESEALMVAEQVMSALRRPVSIEGHELFVSASVGIAVSTARDSTITDLLRKADIALYRAKAEGRARYALYHPAQDFVTVDQLDLDTALRRAIERHQLLLYYQPEVDLITTRVVGMEALLRWDHPYRGVLSPVDFISLAEETGEIVNIGQWVLEEACRQAAYLNSRPNREADLLMSVNLSAAEFRQESIGDRIAEVLDRTGLPPSQLRLEITESVLMDNLPVTIETLNGLKSLGVQLAIDDFGTGYSSLSYLQKLPVDTLKIDQVFIGNLGHDERSYPIVTAVVALGEALGLDVTAEGIESASQLDYLRAVGCRRGQGNYFSSPIDRATLVEILR